jgi:short-chain fatty acids transporter
VIYASGPSASIPLSQASAGNALNIVEKITGTSSLRRIDLRPFNVVPTLIVLTVMPFVLVLVRPAPEETRVFVPPVETPAPAPASPAVTASRAGLTLSDR